MERRPRRVPSGGTLKNVLCIAVLTMFLLSLLPIGLIARYNYPLGDDWIFGGTVAEAYAQSGSLLAAFREAAHVVHEKYDSWQGTFSAIFLMALQPGVFGLSCYALTPYLLIGALVASSLFFSGVLMLGYIRTDRRSWLILTFTLLFFSVQLPPSARQGFFWYNGGVYYTFFHALFLTLGGLLLLSFRMARRGAQVACGILIVFLAGLIGGANYATALPCGIALLCALAYGIAYRRTDAVCIAAGAILSFGIAMYFSIAAPGNAVRQAAVSAAGYAQAGPVKAILLSLGLAAAAFVKRFDMAALLLVGMTVMLTAPYIRDRVHFSFPMPVLVCLFTFGAFASEFTPSVYASMSPGPERLRNLVFFNFYWMICFDAAYVTGWYIRRRSQQAEIAGESTLIRLSRFLRRHPIAVTFACGAVVCGVLLQHGLTDTTSACAVMELWDGTAESHGAVRYAEWTGAAVQGVQALSKLLS